MVRILRLLFGVNLRGNESGDDARAGKLLNYGVAARLGHLRLLMNR